VGRHAVPLRAENSVYFKNLVFGTDGLYPYQKQGWRAQRAGFRKTCTDEKPVRAQATIVEEAVFLSM
jgi:hypothetical protein